MFGKQGESRAARFLVSKGYRVLATNVCFGRHEVDLIALDVAQNELVFVEVKTRSGDAFGDPSQAVTGKKIASMGKVATAYLRETGRTEDYRFDILAVLPGTIHHYQNITWD